MKVGPSTIGSRANPTPSAGTQSKRQPSASKATTQPSAGTATTQPSPSQDDGYKCKNFSGPVSALYNASNVAYGQFWIRETAIGHAQARMDLIQHTSVFSTDAKTIDFAPFLTIHNHSFYEKAKEPFRCCGHAIGARCLYNRYLIWQQSRSSDHEEDEGVPPDHLRHFMIVLCTANPGDFSIYLYEPRLDDKGKWTGCVISKLMQRKLTWVKDLFSWVMRINDWAKNVYAPACEAELMAISAK